MERTKELATEEMVALLIKLPASDHDRLLKLSKKTGMSKAGVLRHFLRNSTLVSRKEIAEKFEVVSMATPPKQKRVACTSPAIYDEA